MITTTILVVMWALGAIMAIAIVEGINHGAWDVIAVLFIIFWPIVIMFLFLANLWWRLTK